MLAMSSHKKNKLFLPVFINIEIKGTQSLILLLKIKAKIKYSLSIQHNSLCDLTLYDLIVVCSMYKTTALQHVYNTSVYMFIHEHTQVICLCSSSTHSFFRFVKDLPPSPLKGLSITATSTVNPTAPPASAVGLQCSAEQVWNLTLRQKIRWWSWSRKDFSFSPQGLIHFRF